MALTLASGHLSDDEFLDAFHSCRLQNDEFRHGDHLRLAWIHLRRAPFEQAVVQVRSGIKAFALHHGVPQLYHETITLGWMHLLATHRQATFDDFLKANHPKLGNELPHRHWRPELLASPVAKAEWVEPDLHPLPQRDAS